MRWPSTLHSVHHPVEKHTVTATSRPALLSPANSPTRQRRRNMHGQRARVSRSTA
jgi:hypothetical protein